jgi:diguanylate cyclase (GGDEF)-like protein
MKSLNEAQLRISKLRPNAGLLCPALLFVGYLIWTLACGVDAKTYDLVSDLLVAVCSGLGSVWALWGYRERKAIQAARGGSRGTLSPNLLSCGLLSYFIGGCVLCVYRFVLHTKPDSSCADLFLLAGATLSVAGLLCFPGRRLSGVVRARVFVDSLMIMTALVTFSWFFTLGPTVLDTQNTPLGKALNAIYPMMDLVMMFCVIAVSSHASDSGLRRARNLLCGAIVCIVVADGAFLYLSNHGLFTSGSPFDAGWMVASLLSGQGILALRNHRAHAAELSTDQDADRQRPAALWRSLLPYALVPAVGALVVHVWRAQVHPGLALGVYIGGAVLIGLILVRQVFAIVENSRLYSYLQEAYRELQALATTDSMTGLWNHRTFQERFRAELAKSQTSGEPVSLLLIDVDRFKAYNDNFGHPAGDEALRLVAKVLKENVGPNDIPARYGGEEFAAVLPSRDEIEALAVAERIRAACEAQEFPHRRVTLSIGVVSGVGGEAGEFIEGADRCLYAAKHRGRNRVVGSSAVEFDLDVIAHPGELEGLTGPAEALVNAISDLLTVRGADLEVHSDRAVRYCLRLAQEANRSGIVRLSRSQLTDLHVGAMLHDIGKIRVPDAILKKPGALTEDEWKIVQRHPVDGAELLAEFPVAAGAIPVIRSHHERWDGKGYPDRLSGEAIPLGARLLSIADAVDAMWSDRCYRKGLEFDAIVEELIAKSGSQFDPALVRVFLGVPQSEWEALRDGISSEGDVFVPEMLSLAA